MRLSGYVAVCGLVAASAGLGSVALAAGPGGPASVAGLAARLSPAVVNISSSHRVADGTGVPFPKAPNGSPLNDFLDQGNPNDGKGDQAMADAESLGSGFLISPDGVIVTNNHVIEGADDIEVDLTDGTHLPATVVGVDTKTDLAVLRISAGHALPFVAFGDSDAAEVGDWVMAIGNPFGLGGTVTLGIVSARHRNIQSGPYDSFIQTDASINQGNSGGPLFDMYGKVIGINTAIVARGGGSLGIGFAIPGDLAKPVVDQLIAYGEARRGWIGVGIQDVSDDIAASLGRTDTHGAMVTDVTKSGPSDGVLNEGDIILQFDGKAVETMHDLPRLVAVTPVGKAVPVTVLRSGEEQALSITLGLLADKQHSTEKSSKAGSAPPAKQPAPVAGAQTLADRVGFAAAAIDAQMRKVYAIPNGVVGLVITSVKSGSDADVKGLTPGLVLDAVNQQPVRSVADLRAQVAAVAGAKRPLLLKVVDAAGQARFVGVKLSE
jgi:serine protease Do